MEDLLATGRLSYYPLCEYVEEGRIVSLLDSDLKYEVKVKKKTVNATCLTTDVPATRPPQYGVADGVTLFRSMGSRISKNLGKDIWSLELARLDWMHLFSCWIKMWILIRFLGLCPMTVGISTGLI